MSQRIVPVPEEISLGDERIIVGALTDRQHVALDRWAASQSIKLAAESLPDDHPLWDRVVGAASTAALSVTWLASGVMRTDAGYARIIWESQKDHSKLSESRVIVLLAASTVAQQKLFNAAFNRLNFPSKSDEAKQDKEGPPQPA